VHVAVPDARRLLEAVERLLEQTHTATAVVEPFWLLHVDLLVHVDVEERRSHVELVELILLDGCNREQNTQRFHLRHGSERLVVVLTRHLHEALDHVSCLELVDGAIVL